MLCNVFHCIGSSSEAKRKEQLEKPLEHKGQHHAAVQEWVQYWQIMSSCQQTVLLEFYYGSFLSSLSLQGSSKITDYFAAFLEKLFEFYLFFSQLHSGKYLFLYKNTSFSTMKLQTYSSQIRRLPLEVCWGFQSCHVFLFITVGHHFPTRIELTLHTENFSYLSGHLVTLKASVHTVKFSNVSLTVEEWE